MAYSKCEWLACDCDTGEFTSAVNLWANQYGSKVRYFCPNCPQCTDVWFQWTEKTHGVRYAQKVRHFQMSHGFDPRTQMQGNRDYILKSVKKLKNAQ